jgi:ribosomal peptide maturation radical SAM protein 1
LTFNTYGVIAPIHRNKYETFLLPPRATVNNLDDIPTPDYDDYFEALHNSSLNSIVHPGLLVETSRGCWWGQKSHCTFCGLNGNGMAYRYKSSARVIEEFFDLSRRYKIHKFEVVDNILSLDHLNELLPIFAKQKERYEIFYETKANLTRQQVEQLAKAGVIWIQPGIEGLHDSVLKLMKKGTNTAINVQLLKWSREFGLQVAWNMLCHFPGESDEWYLEMAQWLPLIIHLQPPSGLSRIQYHRFSPYHDRPEEFGIKITPFKNYSYVYPLLPKAIKDLAYFFESGSELSTSSLKEGIIERPGLQTTLNCLVKWTNLFQSNSPPLLCMSEQGEELQIIDTRPCAVQHLISLTGLHKKIYFLCDKALTPREIIKALSSNYEISTSWEEIQVSLDELQKLKILIKLSGRFLSLAVSDRMPDLCSVEDYPGGYTDISCDDDYAIFGIRERSG